MENNDSDSYGQKKQMFMQRMQDAIFKGFEQSSSKTFKMINTYNSRISQVNKSYRDSVFAINLNHIRMRMNNSSKPTTVKNNELVVKDLFKARMVYEKDIKIQKTEPSPNEILNDSYARTLECKQLTIKQKYKVVSNQNVLELKKMKGQNLQVPHATTEKLKIKNRSIKQHIKALPKLQFPIKDKSLLIKTDPFLKTIKTENYCLIDAQTNEFILAYNFNKRLEIASLTKIMTFYCIKKICDEFQIDIKATNYQIQDEINIVGTKADMSVGQIYTIEQLLYGLMLPSGNDAAICLARWGGNILRSRAEEKKGIKKIPKIKRFVNHMNKLSHDLCLEDTKFDNVHGLSNSQNKSSCRDIAKLCSICMKDRIFMEVVATEVYRFKVNHINSRFRYNKEWYNTNKLLRRPGFLGIKTGITVTAGPCLATAYQFRSKVYITVLLRSPKVSRRFSQTRRLIAYMLKKSFNNLSAEEIETIENLQKSNKEMDSDYSSDEQQFNYKKNDVEERIRRIKIISQH